MTDVNGPNPKDLAGRSKPDLSLCTGPMLAALAAGLTDGAAKYGVCNWRTISVEARTYIAAAMRHQAQWLDGEETALDSGVHHLDHAIATLCILRDAMACGTMIDNRAPTGPAPGASTRVFAAHQARVLGSVEPKSMAPVDETCVGCGLKTWQESSVSVCTDGRFRCNDCAFKHTRAR